MQDRVGTMMIIRSLRDIADELKAVHQELRQLNGSNLRREPPVQKAFPDQSEIDDAFDILLQRKERER
jgi:hypothetical protein